MGKKVIGKNPERLQNVCWNGGEKYVHRYQQNTGYHSAEETRLVPAILLEVIDDSRGYM